jgi:hypothetical protein
MAQKGRPGLTVLQKKELRRRWREVSLKLNGRPNSYMALECEIQSLP